MNPLMNSVGSNAEGKLNCINAVVITHDKSLNSIKCEEKPERHGQFQIFDPGI